MRILCLTNLFPNAYQPGKGIFNWHGLSHLGKHAEVRVISPIAWTDELRARRNAQPGIIADRWNDWKGVSVAYSRYLYTPQLLRRQYGRFFEWSVARTFAWAVNDFRPDILYACWAYPDGWAAIRLGRRYHLPVAIKLHGSDVLLAHQSRGRAGRTAEVLREADCLSAVSSQLREAAIRLGAPADRSFVIYEGTDTELFCPGDKIQARQSLGLQETGARLLFIGNLIPLKGVSRLLEACQRLVQSGLELEADILGDGPLRRSLEQEIANRGLTGRVHLRGWRPQGELVAWYRSADLVVLPSASEGVPNVLVEAAACGTPFVATAVGGIPEIADLIASELVPPGDSAALTEAVRKMLLRMNGGEAASRTNMIRSVGDTALELMGHFERLVARNSAAEAKGSRSSNFEIGLSSGVTGTRD